MSQQIIQLDANDLRALLREEVSRVLAEQENTSPWLDVPAAAEYLSMTPEAIRGASRPGGPLRAHRSSTGRVRFLRSDLDAFQSGGSV